MSIYETSTGDSWRNFVNKLADTMVSITSDPEKTERFLKPVGRKGLSVHGHKDIPPITELMMHALAVDNGYNSEAFKRGANQVPNQGGGIHAPFYQERGEGTYSITLPMRDYDIDDIIPVPDDGPDDALQPEKATGLDADRLERNIQALILPIEEVKTGPDWFYDPTDDVIRKDPEARVPKKRRPEHLVKTLAEVFFRRRRRRLPLGISAPKNYAGAVTALAGQMMMVKTGAEAEKGKTALNDIKDLFQCMKQDREVGADFCRDYNEVYGCVESVAKGIVPKLAVYAGALTDEDSLAMKDIIRKGGFDIDPRNWKDGEQGKQNLDDKLGNLAYYEGERRKCEQQIAKSEENGDDPRFTEIWRQIRRNEATRIVRHVRDNLPRNAFKGNTYIARTLSVGLDPSDKCFCVIGAKDKTIVDVLLPTRAYAGGVIQLPDGKELPYRETPDEIMSYADRIKVGAKDLSNDEPGMSKARIEEALKSEGYKYVRFFQKEGVLSYNPSDDYFQDKDAGLYMMIGKKIEQIQAFDVPKTLQAAKNAVLVDNLRNIGIIQDDDGRYALYMKADKEESFSVYLDDADIKEVDKRFDEGTVADRDFRRQLALKYYPLAEAEPDRKVDLHYDYPADIDMSAIKDITMGRTADGRIVAAVEIEGLDEPQNREITGAQFWRLWVADDPQKAKECLVANVLEDILPRRDENLTEDYDLSEDLSQEQDYEEEQGQDIEQGYEEQVDDEQDLEEEVEEVIDEEPSEDEGQEGGRGMREAHERRLRERDRRLKDRMGGEGEPWDKTVGDQSWVEDLSREYLASVLMLNRQAKAAQDKEKEPINVIVRGKQAIIIDFDTRIASNRCGDILERYTRQRVTIQNHPVEFFAFPAELVETVKEQFLTVDREVNVIDDNLSQERGQRRNQSRGQAV